MNEIVWLHRSIDDGLIFSMFHEIPDVVIKTIISFVCVVFNDEQWKRIQTFLAMTYQTFYEPDKKVKKQNELKKRFLMDFPTSSMVFQ